MPTLDKSEILFLYDATYTVPNGDPFTGEQRYDDETKKVLVSDVRIKRYVRDYVAATNPEEIFVLDSPPVSAPTASATTGKKAESGASARSKTLADGKMTLEKFIKLFDVRLFGGIVTAEKAAINLTGPVQFAMLNPSLNRVDLRMHQNTSVFASSTDNSRGAIGTTTVVPYAVLQIHGWVNPFTAEKTGLQEADLNRLFEAMWNGVNNINTRSKSNQNSLLLLQVIYSSELNKLSGLDRVIALKSIDGKRDEQLRSEEDYTLDFSLLEERFLKSDRVKEIRYYTDSTRLETALSVLGNNKLKKMSLFELTKE